MKLHPELLAELKPGSTYVIEVSEPVTTAVLRNISTSLEHWGEPRGISFLVLPSGVSIVRSGRLRRRLLRWLS